MPSRCVLDGTDGPDYALCMTSSTLDDRAALDVSGLVGDNFTVSFFAKAREPLVFPQTSSTSGVLRIPRGMLFYPQWGAPAGDFSRMIGFHLGTDGLSVVWHGAGVVASVVVQRMPLIGWHHYSIVYSGGEVFVYVDGNSRDSAQLVKAIDRSQSVGFYVAFGRTRYIWTDAGGAWGSGFEGWLSELRLANRSMHGGEARAQMENASAWDFSYSMRGCSGENHTGTDIERFKLQQAWLVCKEPMPTCTANGGPFVDWDAAGCSCRDNTGSLSCVSGYMSPDKIVFLRRPIAYWRLYDVDENGTVPDASGYGRRGQFIGKQGVDYTINSAERFVAFNGSAYVDFGDNDAFDFGTRNFAIEFRMRANASAVSEFVVAKRGACSHGNFFCLQTESDGRGVFEVDNSGFNYIPLYSAKTIRDGKWHRVLLLRLFNMLEIFVDGVSCGKANSIGVANLNNTYPLSIGRWGCAGMEPGLHVHLAEMAVYVDVNSPPHRLCDLNGDWPGAATTMSALCSLVAGVCSPFKDGRQCCAVAGCAECGDYRLCSQNFTTTRSVTTRGFSTVAGTLSKTGVTSFLTSTSIVSNVFTTSASQLPPPITNASPPTTLAVIVGDSTPPAWIFGAVAGGVVALLLIIGAVGLACWCNKRASTGRGDASLTSLPNPQTGIF
ncbi:MAG: hypothetical protein IPK82_23170 [Polyangiaceae bacterium]|nr:hypothetical protein [Polyangiaceae bacterium]